MSIHYALDQKFSMPFARPTSLDNVRKRLQKTLGCPVVLDRAALNRQELRPEDTVQLELDGVRLKTYLQLLLDQVSLTYRIVPEDNLLILTDKEGSDDPITKIWAEIRELHRDLHDLQDSVDDLTDLLVPEGAELRMRKPTIVEERPEAGESKQSEAVPQPDVSGRSRIPEMVPGPRSGGRIKPPVPEGASPPAGETPGRTPLGRSRKRA